MRGGGTGERERERERERESIRHENRPYDGRAREDKTLRSTYAVSGPPVPALTP